MKSPRSQFNCSEATNKMSQLFKLFSLFCLAILIQQGSAKTAVKLCVIEQIELDKCNDIKTTLEQNGVEAKLECTMDKQDSCIQKVKTGEVDIIVVDTTQQIILKDSELEKILYETYPTNNIMVAVADSNLSQEDIKIAPLVFSADDIREIQAAAFFNHLRKGKTCEKIQPQVGPKSIKILRSTELSKLKGKQLICTDMSRGSLTQSQNCNMETGSVNVVLTKKDNERKNEIIKMLKNIVREVGPGGKLIDEIKLFGTYKGEKHIIFTDDGKKLETERKTRNGIDEDKLSEIFCDGTVVEHLNKN